MAYIDSYGVEYSNDRKTLVKCPVTLKGHYMVNSSVETIAKRAFYQCKDLTSISLPLSIINIESFAFGFCVNLQLINIPTSITKIERGLFYKCRQLKSVIIPSSVVTIEDCAFWQCQTLDNVVIPTSVIKIGGGAFAECSALTNITIPDSVTEIGASAFIDCENITSISLPNRITQIGYQTFMNCHNLKSITIPNGVTKICKSAFKNCRNLSSIVIPSTVNTIEKEAFEFCRNLDLVLPNTITSVGEMALLGSNIKRNAEALNQPVVASKQEKNKDKILIFYVTANYNLIGSSRYTIVKLSWKVLDKNGGIMPRGGTQYIKINNFDIESSFQGYHKMYNGEGGVFCQTPWMVLNEFMEDLKEAHLVVSMDCNKECDFMIRLFARHNNIEGQRIIDTVDKYCIREHSKSIFNATGKGIQALWDLYANFIWLKSREVINPLKCKNIMRDETYMIYTCYRELKAKHL